MVDEENLAVIGEGGDENRDFTEITSESYGDKVGEACSGTCTGLFLFFGSIGLLIFNEGRTVKRAKDLAEGRDSVLSTTVSNLTRTDMAQLWDNRLVHTVGDVGTDDTLTDSMFGVGATLTTSDTINATTTLTSTTVKPLLKLRRSVEMFQWKESTRTKTIKNADGSSTTQTTYHYNKQWSSRQIDSSRFRESLHTNPSFPFGPLSLVADPIFLGDRLLLLTDAAIAYLDWYEPLNNVALANIPDTTLRSDLTKYGNNGFFYPTERNGDSTSSNPDVGDARVTFDVVEAGTISIIAKVAGSGGSSNRHSLGSYTTSRGGIILLVEPGRKTADEMFAQATADNTLIAWVFRFVGFFLMVLSILMVLQPIATAVDIIPFVGDYLQGGLEGCIFPTIAILIALPVSLFVVALSWLAYRPYIALPICVVSLIVMIWLRWRHKQASQQQPSSPSLPPPNDPTLIWNDEKPSQNDFSTEPTSPAIGNTNVTYPSPPIMSSTTLYTSTFHYDSNNPMAPAVSVAEGYETIPVLLPPTAEDDLYPVYPTTTNTGTSPIKGTVTSALDTPAEALYQPKPETDVTYRK